VSITKKTRLFALVAALAMVLAACGSDSGSGSTTTTGSSGDLELKKPGTLVVCTDVPYPPMEFVQDGDYTGFDIELMRAIAEDLGLTMEVAEPGWEAITGGLAFETDCDVAASSITITDERKENVDFSDPYFEAEQSLLVKEGSGISDLADMAGKKLAVQTGTTGHFYARDNGPEGIEIVEFQDADGPLLAMEAGQVDGFMTDLVVTQDFVNSHEGFEVVATYPTDEVYGLAVKKDGAPNLLAALNASLKKLRDNGTYDRIYNEWFGN
jgi:polar amino acid transport system substrate-binding protein